MQSKVKDKNWIQETQHKDLEAIAQNTEKDLH